MRKRRFACDQRAFGLSGVSIICRRWIRTRAPTGSARPPPVPGGLRFGDGRLGGDVFRFDRLTLHWLIIIRHGVRRPGRGPALGRTGCDKSGFMKRAVIFPGFPASLGRIRGDAFGDLRLAVQSPAKRTADQSPGAAPGRSVAPCQHWTPECSQRRVVSPIRDRVAERLVHRVVPSHPSPATRRSAAEQRPAAGRGQQVLRPSGNRRECLLRWDTRSINDPLTDVFGRWIRQNGRCRPTIQDEVSSPWGGRTLAGAAADP